MKTSAAKIGLVAGMIASALLLGACTSSQQLGKAAVAGSNGFARQTGTLATAWGKMPTYSLQSQELRQIKHRFSWLPVLLAGIDNTAKVDVLVNRDGSVRDVSIVESSGNPVVDSTIMPGLADVRIATKIAPEDPAPYVVRTLVVLPKRIVNSYSIVYDQVHYTGEPLTRANDWVWVNR